MIVRVKLSERDFINASVATVWTKPLSRFIFYFYIFLLVLKIISDPYINYSILTSIAPIVSIILILYFGLRFVFKNSFKNNYRAGEEISYNFTEDKVIVTGESFKTEMSWNKVYKISKTKNWFFIWHNNRVANPIPLNLLSREDLLLLKGIAINQRVRNNL